MTGLLDVDHTIQTQRQEKLSDSQKGKDGVLTFFGADLSWHPMPEVLHGAAEERPNKSMSAPLEQQHFYQTRLDVT